MDEPRVRELTEPLYVRPLFVGLTLEQTAALLRLSEFRSYGPEQTVVAEGDPGDALYMLLSGVVRVVKNGTAVATLEGGDALGTQYGGDFFGEMSLVDLEPRSATIRAAGSVDMLRFPREPLLEYLRTDRDAHVVILTNIARILSRRLRAAQERQV